MQFALNEGFAFRRWGNVCLAFDSRDGFFYLSVQLPFTQRIVRLYRAGASWHLENDPGGLVTEQRTLRRPPSAHRKVMLWR